MYKFIFINIHLEGRNNMIKPIKKLKTIYMGDLILDDHSISTLPRPGTSLRVIGTGQGGNRPITSSGRPMTGVVRPGTMSRVGTSSGNIVRAGTGAAPGSQLHNRKPLRPLRP